MKKLTPLFLLSMIASECPRDLPFEACNNGIDDDGNGQIDCRDEQCSSAAVCAASFERCDDAVDNDGDLLVDCEDPDCSLSDTCKGLEFCDDNIDNDLDGFKDCADQDCFGVAPCTPPTNQATLDLIDGGAGILDYSENVVGGGFFGHPTEAGDINGDGLIDVVSCAIAADSGAKSAAGAVTIFLSDGTIDGLRLPGDPNTVRIEGERALDFLGASAHVADVNGDGFADVIIGAQGYDGPTQNRPMVGAVYVVFGAATLPATIDLSQPTTGVTRITGDRTNDRLGIWVGSGDLNNDGVEDLLLAADQYDGLNQEKSNAGIVYAIDAQNLPAEFDLATTGINANRLFAQVIGESSGDHFGGSLFGGDVDGDGKDDLASAAVMARLSASMGDNANGEDPIDTAGGAGPGDSRPFAGDVHVFFGPISGTIDLGDNPPSHLTIFGGAQFDFFGEELVLSDMDNDGDEDLLVGALGVSREDAFSVGATYLIPGDALLRTAGTIDIANPPAGVIEFLGDEQGEISGDTLAAPDLDGDGIREIAIARPVRTVRRNDVLTLAAGRITVFFDVASLPPLVDLRSLDASFSFVEILGIDDDDTLAYSMNSGDVDGDGKEELIPNLMRGDGPNNQIEDAGEIVVIAGPRISALIGR